ncbi:MAG TPA: hypothetical protein VIH18_04170 [Candidatus Binatia bacterium]|jgi:hypothetical protein
MNNAAALGSGILRHYSITRLRDGGVVHDRVTEGNALSLSNVYFLVTTGQDEHEKFTAGNLIHFSAAHHPANMFGQLRSWMVIMATSRGRGKLSQTLSVIGGLDTGMASAASRDF